MYEARFDSNGKLFEINGTRPDGATASLDVENATTSVDGSDVTVSPLGDTLHLPGVYR